MKPVSLLIVGAGGRGSGFASYAARRPDAARVAGVAEPRQAYRRRLAEAHGIPPDRALADWRQAAERERFADAAVIATPDAVHAAPAVAFAEKGYHILLEKPMATNEADCRRIAAAAVGKGICFAVCHVMRYTEYTERLKLLVDSGRIGDVVSIQHLEPVGYWHQAHSFVRGNWRSEAESSFMLLAKSCHDLDWLRYVMGVRCLRVASFGSLQHFRREHQPAGAADRCLDCAVEPDCPYSARRIYLGRLAEGHAGWPVDVLAPEVTTEAVTQALRTGPYGRCVYACDNDVVDHQVVAMEFEGGRTATFTMTAFTEMAGRKTRIFGTRGCLRGDGRTIEHFDFLTSRRETIDTRARAAGIEGGHGGGDGRLMAAFLRAVATGDTTHILSGPAETLESHLMVFAAERARREGAVVCVPAVELTA